MRRLARIAAKFGISCRLAAMEDSSAEVRSARGSEFVSSDEMAMVSGCAQFIAAVIVFEVSALPETMVWWQESESRSPAAICAGQWLGVAQSVPQRGAMNIASMVTVAIAAGRCCRSARFMVKVNATPDEGTASNHELE